MRGHVRYKQYYKGYEVENAGFMVEAKWDIVQMIHGKIASGLNIGTSNPISESTALQAALNYINATEYAWENSDQEDYIRRIKHDSTATYYPKGKLIIARKHGTDIEEKDYAFVWRFYIVTTIPISEKTVDINALTGAVFNSYDPSQSGFCGQGEVLTWYNGNQLFNTWSCTFCPSWLLDDCRGHNGNTGISTTLRTISLTDLNNYWDWENERPATTAHWIGQVSWDYFKYRLGRDGIDNDKRLILIRAGYNSSYPTKFLYGEDAFQISTSSSGNSMSALDIVGHEFTHGVQKYTSNLI
jgi:Zn-dependent metalloprotease